MKALFEVSWEVCNKVGGIYTVITSKAEFAKNQYKEGYFTIGPYFHDKIIGEFEEIIPPEDFKSVFGELKQQGIICHYGKWLLETEQRAILIDFHLLKQQTNDIKKQLWESFQIDTLNSPPDFDEPLVWSWAVGMLLEKIKQKLNYEMVAQFHEWLTGPGLLYLKKNNCNVATVFTTHATVLGRSISSSQDLLKVMDNINPTEQAYNYGIPSKFLTEKASAEQCDVFTTVSETTGFEAEKLLGRKPDVILPNGLNIKKFPTFEELSIKHKDMKYKIKEFLIYDFFPYYSFNIDETLIYFIVARYEFHNKGIDTMIKALGKLNKRLQEDNSEKTVVAFFFVPAAIKGIRYNLLENKRYYEDIKESIQENLVNIKNKLIVNMLSMNRIKNSDLLSDSFMKSLKKKTLRFTKTGTPPLSSHELYDEHNDIIIKSFHEEGLTNKEEDKVKVVFYPAYLTGADGLIDLNVYETIIGGHLGIYPSKYEPWGYTPVEAGALGVSAITTDRSGFGKYLLGEKQKNKMIKNSTVCDLENEKGIFIARFEDKSEDQEIEELFHIMYYFSKLDKGDRVENKIEARRLAGLADWENLFSYYIKAHNMALEKHK